MYMNIVRMALIIIPSLMEAILLPLNRESDKAPNEIAPAAIPIGKSSVTQR